MSKVSTRTTPRLLRLIKTCHAHAPPSSAVTVDCHASIEDDNECLIVSFSCELTPYGWLNASRSIGRKDDSPQNTEPIRPLPPDEGCNAFFFARFPHKITPTLSGGETKRDTPAARLCHQGTKLLPAESRKEIVRCVRSAGGGRRINGPTQKLSRVRGEMLFCLCTNIMGRNRPRNVHSENFGGKTRPTTFYRANQREWGG